MKIGLTQRVLMFKERAYDSLGQEWYSYLKSHTLVAVPNRLDQDFDKLADELDLLVITGGDDRLIRRTTELRLSTALMKQQKPILGVCHGAFLLTDVLGGTIGRKDGHRGGVNHQIRYRDKMQQVNSYHGLAIKTAPASADILAVDADGDCEAWISGTVAAVVWHPERMTDPWLPDEIQSLLFKEDL